jgi:hypothetical protein
MPDRTIHDETLREQRTPVDEGLVHWANLVRAALQAQSGVEIIGTDGGSLHFAFRGQSFAITVQRTS